MVHAGLQMLILNLKAGKLIRWAGGTVGHEAFDDLLYAVAVLEGVDDGQFLLLWEALRKLWGGEGGGRGNNRT